MGCDIHIFTEIQKANKWEEETGDNFSLDKYDRKRLKKKKGRYPFDWRSYALFGFLADVRNYSHCEPLSECKGLPDDSEYLNEEVDDG